MPPLEASIIRYARQVGVAPWVLEAECSEYWWDWLQAYDAAQLDAMKK